MRSLTVKGTPRLRKYPQGRNKPGTPPAERILRYVEVDAAGHWIWQASRDTGGYGQITIDQRVSKAHRVSYEAFVGPIPEGLQIDHLCRVRECVNPDHLEPVTPLVNTRRSPLTHGNERACPWGHPYSETNTYRHEGRRYCLTCRDARNYLWRTSTPEQRDARKAAGLPVLDLAAYFAEQESAA